MRIAFTSQSSQKAAQALREGQLVSFPTETVYGLGADSTNDRAVAQIYTAKGRPSFNPLIAHVASLAQAQDYGIFDDHSLALAKQFWPGALTLVVPLKPNSPISKLVTAGLDSLALRVPAPQNVRDLIDQAGTPIAAPSANISGKISPTTAKHVETYLDQSCAYILDDGPCAAGLESTIIDVRSGSITLLRPGPVTRQMLEEACPQIPFASSPSHQDDKSDAMVVNDAAPTAPGQLTSHYAPNKAVVLDVTTPQSNDIYIGFGPTIHQTAFNLSETGDLTQAAAQLFAILHEADKHIGKRIAFAPIPKYGIGLAIYDRLKRAAADRPSTPLLR